MRPLIPLLALIALSCDDDKGPAAADSGVAAIDTLDSAAVAIFDADGDGVTTGDGDCNDSDPDVYPGRTEDCNGLDDNCNDLVDEGFPDADTDSVADCVDVEECDGVDNDGDEDVDEGFPDSDYDGVADCVTVEACDGIDNDSDGETDEGFDVDGDGYTSCDGDCDDEDASVNPGAEEVPDDEVDNDCDGLTDVTSVADISEGSLIITEIMSNPEAVADGSGEWIEIHNPGLDTIYLSGMILESTDGDWHEIVADATLAIEGGESIVLGNNPDSSTNGGVRVAYSYGADISLNNAGDDISLVAGDVLVDHVSWADGSFPDENGASVMLDIVAYGADLNDYGSNWCISVEPWGTGTDDGSPTDENPLCSSIDHDGDGYSADEDDCDDYDDTVYPGAPEVDPDVDNDCDGDEEQAPVAVAAWTSTAQHCDPIYLDGSGSYDPEGAPLSYLWTLESAPSDSARSSGDIQTQTDVTPIFTPDADGTYEISLVVNDGGDDSEPDLLTITVTERTTNSAPVADAGADQSQSETATCTEDSYGDYECDDCSDYDFLLDGTGSSDMDLDSLTYEWTITSGESYATISDSTSATPTVTVTGSAVTYGETETTEVTLELKVTDCYGESSTDSVTLTMECVGG